MSTPVPPSVSPFAQRSADSEQESKRSASAFACKDRSCHTHSGRQHVHIPEHCSVRGASHDIIVYQPSRRLSAVGSAYTRTLTSNKHISYDIWIKCRYNHALWCGGGEVAKLAACESTADDPLTVSVDSATAEEDKKTKPSTSSSNMRQRARSSSASKALSPARPMSVSTRSKAGERHPSRKVAQCLQTTTEGPQELRSIKVEIFVQEWITRGHEEAVTATFSIGEAADN